jgi:hypothetical protein
MTAPFRRRFTTAGTSNFPMANYSSGNVRS